jgi:hypothetical protein
MEVIGQERGIKALQLGVSVKSGGYNVFVTSFEEPLDCAVIEKLLKDMKANDIHDPKSLLLDHLYVNNFKNPDYPRHIAIAPGKGKQFQRDMDQLITDFKETARQIFESDSYQRKKKQLESQFVDKQQAISRELEKRVNSEHFRLVQTQVSIDYMKC